MSTNKTLLVKGLRNLGFLVLLFIISPIALTVSYKTLDKFPTEKIFLAYIFISISILLILFTIFFAFKTFKLVLDAFFNSQK